MSQVTFITGNQAKADFLARHVNHPIAHKKVELEEIQSLDLAEIATHKAKQAYTLIKTPVLVEDGGLIVESMGKLPGPFIKWFHLELGLEKMCRLIDSLESRKAKINVCFAYYDGRKLELFKGEISGRIADTPKGTNGFGFDPIFIRDGHDKTLAEMSDEELERYSLRTSTVYPKIKHFLEELDKIS